MRVLVTGGAGFIGSAFVRYLIEGRWAPLTGCEVVVLDALATGGTLTSLAPVRGSPRLRIEVGDIRDPVLVTRLMTGTDLVLHFAAETHVDRSITDGAPFVSVNVLGSQVLLEAAVRSTVPSASARARGWERARSSCPSLGSAVTRWSRSAR